MRIYLNDQFVTERNAMISILDHGFLYGDGIFETLRAYNGILFRPDDHLYRLEQSAQKLKIILPCPIHRLHRLLNQTLSINRLQNALLRICISRGPGPIGLDPDLCRKPTLAIIPRTFVGYSQNLYRRGLTVAIVSVRRMPAEALDPAIKSANFLNNILAKIEAKQKGADEGIMLTLDGYLAEGSICNLFFVKRRRLFTPSTGLGILAGITRRLVIDLAKRAAIPVAETRRVPSDLYKADECFLTNSSLEVMPVVRADGVRIGNGKPGPVTRLLRQGYQEQVRLECRRRKP